MKRYDVLASYWYTPRTVPGQIGLVVISTGPAADKWKCYIGIVMNGGNREDWDEQFVAAHGAKVTKEVAVAHFPGQDPDKFVY